MVASSPKTLHRAAGGGNLALVTSLLDAGADIDELDEVEHGTPLLWALWAERTEVVELLLARGADPNRLGFRGTTPLEVAIDAAVDQAILLSDEKGVRVPASTTLVELLLDAGADPARKNAKGRDALDIARHLGHDEAVDLFEERQVQRQRHPYRSAP